MSAELSFGFMLMATGMITVFTILSLVVAGGKIMILLINKFSPDEIMPPSSGGEGMVSKSQVAAISAAVNMTTGGKGTITDIIKQ